MKRKGISFGLTASLALHAIMFIGFIWGFGFPERSRVSNERIVTLEIVNVAKTTNIQTRKITPRKKPKPKNIPKEEDVKEAKVKPVVKPIKKEPKIEPKKKPVSKPKDAVPLPEKKEKKPEKKKEKKVEEVREVKDELEDLFKQTLKNVAASEEEIDNTEEEFDDLLSALSDDQTDFDASKPVTVTVKQSIKSQIEKHWVVPAGAKDAQNMIITILLKLASSGEVIEAEVHSKHAIRYGTDSTFRAAAESAKRAAYKASPLQGLPQEQYGGTQGWNKLEVTFDPSQIIY